MKKIWIMSAGALALSTAAYAQESRDATTAQPGAAQQTQTQQEQTDQHTQTQSGQADWSETDRTRTQTGQTDWEETGDAMERQAERTGDKAGHAMKKAGAKLSEAAEDAGQAVDENMRRLASDATAPYDQEEAQAIRAVVDATSKPVVLIGDHAVLTRNAHSIEKLMGQDLYNATGDRLAAVDDVILDQDGRARALIVSAGGFLGLNAREHEISFDRVRLQPGENGEQRLTVDTTSDELRSQPRYERSAAANGEIFASDLIGTEVDFERTAALDARTGDQAQRATTDRRTTPGHTTAGAAETDPQAQLDSQTTGQAQTAADARADAERREGGQATTTTTTTTAQGARDEQIDTAMLRDLVLDGEGRAQFAVLGYDGVLGMGETEAIVAYDQIQIAQGGEGLYFSGSSQELADATKLAASVDEALDQSARDDRRGATEDRQRTDEMNPDRR